MLFVCLLGVCIVLKIYGGALLQWSNSVLFVVFGIPCAGCVLALACLGPRPTDTREKEDEWKNKRNLYLTILGVLVMSAVFLFMLLRYAGELNFTELNWVLVVLTC